MANAYKVTLKSISTDGTNLFTEMEIFDGVHALPRIFPMFPVSAVASDITSYMQTIANNQPVLDQGLADIINSTVSGS